MIAAKGKADDWTVSAFLCRPGNSQVGNGPLDHRIKRRQLYARADSVQVEPHVPLRLAPLGTSPTLCTAVQRKLPFAFQTCVLAEHVSHLRGRDSGNAFDSSLRERGGTAPNASWPGHPGPRESAAGVQAQSRPSMNTALEVKPHIQVVPTPCFSLLIMQTAMNASRSTMGPSC